MNTKNYIKMCEKNEELQREWMPESGDLVKSNEDGKVHYLYCGEGLNKPRGIENRFRVWLPTLEQLFEMVFKVDTKHRVQRHYGINECDEGKYQLEVTQIDPQDQNYDKEYFSDSFQGCLLQYIYDIEYHKTWTGEKWIIKKEGE